MYLPSKLILVLALPCMVPVNAHLRKIKGANSLRLRGQDSRYLKEDKADKETDKGKGLKQIEDVLGVSTTPMDEEETAFAYDEDGDTLALPVAVEDRKDDNKGDNKGDKNKAKGQKPTEDFIDVPTAPIDESTGPVDVSTVPLDGSPAPVDDPTIPAEPISLMMDREDTIPDEAFWEFADREDGPSGFIVEIEDQEELGNSTSTANATNVVGEISNDFNMEQLEEDTVDDGSHLGMASETSQLAARLTDAEIQLDTLLQLNQKVIDIQAQLDSALLIISQQSKTIDTLTATLMSAQGDYTAVAPEHITDFNKP